LKSRGPLLPFLLQRKIVKQKVEAGTNSCIPAIRTNGNRHRRAPVRYRSQKGVVHEFVVMVSSSLGHGEDLTLGGHAGLQAAGFRIKGLPAQPEREGEALVRTDGGSLG
jgi:hypothetical protein